MERHGLVVLIAIGESVVAAGSGALGLPVDAPLAGVEILGLALSACLWWTYFGGDDERAEHALSEADAEKRPGLALTAFGYWHLPMLLGIIILAAALRESIGHAFKTLDGAHALMMAGGGALFLAGDVFFRRSLSIGSGGRHMAIAVLTLATIPLGIAIAAVAQLAALVALLVSGNAADYLAAKAQTAA